MSYVNVPRYTLAWKYPTLRAPGEPKRPLDGDTRGLEREPFLKSQDGPYSTPKPPVTGCGKVTTVRFYVVLITLILFLACIDIIVRISMMVYVEVRFELPTTAMGLIISSFEFGQVILIIYFSYMDRPTANRPKGVFAGGLLIAVAGVLWAAPHFLYGPGTLPTLNNVTLEANPICKPYSNQTQPKPDLCAESPGSPKGILDIDNRSGTVAYWMMFASQVLLGGGLCPFLSMGVSYLEANANPLNMGLYLGIVFGVAVSGLVVGFVVGGALATIPIDFDFNSPITPDMPEFMAAWWLGPLCVGGLVFILSLPISIFPKEIKAEDKPNRFAKKSKGIHPPSAKPIQRKMKVKDFFAQLWHTATNGLFIFTTLGLCAVNYIIAGLYSFLPKYIEVQFGLPPAKANMVAALISMLAMSGGIFFGCWFSAKVKLTPVGSQRLLLLSVFICLGGLVSLMFVGCPPQQVAGSPDSFGYLNVSSPCNYNCSCGYAFEPVCGDNVNYFSACYAGCQNGMGGQNFSDCGCVPSGIVKAGFCDTSCNKMFYIYCAIMAVISFVAAVPQSPALSVVLRSVDEDVKSLAMGLNSAIVSLLAMIPGPMVFGMIIDRACKVWMPTCQGRGACLLYDTTMYRILMHGTTAGIQVVALAFFCVSWVLLTRIEFVPRAELEKQHFDVNNALVNIPMAIISNDKKNKHQKL